ncbi:uncharacterized protein LOC114877077 [Osmia bicornis bicornis]|uniref:uncharacterized protein LOC114877077 n=1 Tax=Osmia bicornis bicornis TaxID=1437191 RepID=UPI0010F60EA6|nr:uncharacterized protein LOC114877077 [Osmia bicornis bicornis]
MAERKNAEPAKFHKKVEKLTRGALLRRRYRTILNQRSSKINQTFKKVLRGKMLSMISTTTSKKMDRLECLICRSIHTSNRKHNPPRRLQNEIAASVSGNKDAILTQSANPSTLTWAHVVPTQRKCKLISSKGGEARRRD